MVFLMLMVVHARDRYHDSFFFRICAIKRPHLYFGRSDLKGLPVESVIRNLVMEALGHLRESKIALVHDTDDEGMTFSSTVIITEKAVFSTALQRSWSDLEPNGDSAK